MPMHSPASLSVSPLLENGSIAVQSSFASQPRPTIAGQLPNTEDDNPPQMHHVRLYAVSPTLKPLAPSSSTSHPHAVPQPLPTPPDQNDDPSIKSIDSTSRLTSSSSEDPENGIAMNIEGRLRSISTDADRNHITTPHPRLERSQRRHDTHSPRSHRIKELLSDNMQKAKMLAELQTLFESLTRDYERVSEESRGKSLTLRSLREHADALTEELRVAQTQCSLQADQLNRYRTAREDGTEDFRKQLSAAREECKELQRERSNLLEGHRILRKQLEGLQESLESAKEDYARRLKQKQQEIEASVRAGFKEKEQLLELREQEVSREACRLEEGLRRFASESTEAKEDVVALQWRLRELERACEKKDAMRSQLERTLDQLRARIVEFEKTIEAERHTHDQRHRELQAGWRAEVTEVRRLYEIAQADRGRAEDLLREAHRHHDEELACKEREKRELWKEASLVEWELRRELKELKAAHAAAREEVSQHALTANRAQREAEAVVRSKQLLENNIESLQKQLQDAELAKSQLAGRLEVAYTKLAGKEREAEELRCTMEREWWARPRELLQKVEHKDVQADSHAHPLLWKHSSSGSGMFDESTASPEQREERKDRARVAFVASSMPSSAAPTQQVKYPSDSDQYKQSASSQAQFAAQVRGNEEGEGESFHNVGYEPARRPPSMMRATENGLHPPQQMPPSSSPKESQAPRARMPSSRGLVESIERTTRRSSRGPSFSYSPHPYCVDENVCNDDTDASSNVFPSHYGRGWDHLRRVRPQVRTARYCESDDSEMKGAGVSGASSRLHAWELQARYSPGLSFSQPYRSSDPSPRMGSKSRNLFKSDSEIYFDPDVMDYFQSGVAKAPGRARSPSQPAVSGPLEDPPATTPLSRKKIPTRAGTPPIPAGFAFPSVEAADGVSPSPGRPHRGRTSSHATTPTPLPEGELGRRGGPSDALFDSTPFAGPPSRWSLADVEGERRVMRGVGWEGGSARRPGALSMGREEDCKEESDAARGEPNFCVEALRKKFDRI
ncbi:unnamed protein product [Phytomonas sp. EM1]|nr:unnamed protein product [Phytomonas sp. EM1]|eukprot:CCW65759.1 unnamed protein product [Phytomonas sp. isolate EM1]